MYSGLPDQSRQFFRFGPVIGAAVCWEPEFVQHASHLGHAQSERDKMAPIEPLT